MKKNICLLLTFLVFAICCTIKARAAVQTVFLDEAYIEHKQNEFFTQKKQEEKAQQEEKASDKTSSKKSSNKNKPASVSAESFSKEDIEILCKICHAESRGESTQGQMAVANVILNRVKSNKFPNTVKGVVFQSGQFTPAMSSSFYSIEPSEKVRQSVSRVINGERVFGDDVLYFKSVGSSAKWNKLKLRQQIGNHLFYAG